MGVCRKASCTRSHQLTSSRLQSCVHSCFQELQEPSSWEFHRRSFCAHHRIKLMLRVRNLQFWVRVSLLGKDCRVSSLCEWPCFGERTPYPWPIVECSIWPQVHEGAFYVSPSHLGTNYGKCRAWYTRSLCLRSSDRSAQHSRVGVSDESWSHWWAFNELCF